jgi:hypothetical protein
MKNPALKGGVSSFYKEVYFTAGFTTDILERINNLTALKGGVLNPACE